MNILTYGDTTTTGKSITTALLGATFSRSNKCRVLVISNQGAVLDAYFNGVSLDYPTESQFQVTSTRINSPNFKQDELFQRSIRAGVEHLYIQSIDSLVMSQSKKDEAIASMMNTSPARLNILDIQNTQFPKELKTTMKSLDCVIYYFDTRLQSLANLIEWVASVRGTALLAKTIFCCTNHEVAVVSKSIIIETFKRAKIDTKYLMFFPRVDSLHKKMRVNILRIDPKLYEAKYIDKTHLSIENQRKVISVSQPLKAIPSLIVNGDEKYLQLRSAIDEMLSTIFMSKQTINSEYKGVEEWKF